MTTLKQARQPRDTSKMTLITQNRAPLARPALPTSADPGFNPLALAPTPPTFSTDSDQLRQFYRHGVSADRMPPLPAAASPAVGAQIQSHIDVVVSAAGILFETNDVPNTNQSILNITGSGVTYEGAGEVLITSANDGLDHGSSPWEIDPTSVIFAEDFLSGAASNGSIGTNGWGVS